MTDDMPTTIGDYDVIEAIGSGGFGVVYRAHHRVLDRDVAIKLLHADSCRDPAAVARFVAEARAASTIKHPSIVEVLAFGELPDGRSYCVMELLHGRTLRAILDERERLPLPEAQPLLARFAEAIDAAHASGVAHRDLKPENMFVETDGSIRIIDFGLAKLVSDAALTTTGHVMGSPRYMSPEQCRGKGSDTRSDLYSFGAIAYHVLVGEPPFTGDPLGLALHHLNDTPQPPSTRVELPASVDAIVLALLAKDPKRRPQPLTDAVAALTLAVPIKKRSRNPFVFGGVAIAGTTAVTLAFTMGRSPSDKPTGPFIVHPGPTLPGNLDAALQPDGNAIYRSAEPGNPAPKSRTLDLATGATTALDYSFTLGDGRVALIREGHVLSRDPRGTTEELFSGTVAGVSRDGRTIAFWADGWLQVYEFATRQARRLREQRLPVVASFSPDSSTFVWLKGGAVQLTRVADGTTRELKIPVADAVRSSRLAFADNDHLIYCALENGKRTIRLRDTAAIGDPGTVIHELADTVAGCYVTADDNGVIVAAIRATMRLAILDPAHRSLSFFPLATEVPRVIDLSGDGKQLAGGDFDAGFTSIDIATGAQTPLPRCTLADGTGAGITQTSDGFARSLYYYQRGTDQWATELRDLACKIQQTWWFEAPHWCGKLECRGKTCSIATERNGKLTVWLLLPDQQPRSLGQIDMPLSVGSFSLGLSPDGTHAIYAAADGVEPHVFTTGEPPHAFPLPGRAETVVWSSNPQSFVVAGTFLTGATYGAVSINLDGTRQTLWSSDTTWLRLQATPGSGSPIYGIAKDYSTELFILEGAQLLNPPQSTP